MEEVNLAPLVKEVSCKEHIICPEVKYKYSNEKGDGYLGVIRAIELQGKNKSLDVIVKYAAKSENLRKQTPIREAFLTEMWFYDKIIPAQLNFQVEHNIKNPFVNYPKCYGICKTNMEETLFLENLKQYGYQLWNRKKPMNSEHLKFVFNEYGRYHGTNFAIKKLNPALYQELASNLVDMIDLFNVTDGFSGILNKLTAKVKEFFDPIKEKKYYDIVAKFNEAPLPKMRATSELDNYAIILHGDCWCNNMMFKYQNPNDTTKPDSIQLIDFQLSKEGSPVLDLSYFFYVCADKPNFARLEEYLKIYHQSMHNHLSEFGLDVNDVYPFSKLKEHWKRYSRFGYFMSVFLIKIMLSDVDEVPDLADVAEAKAADENSVMNSFDFESRSEGEYRQRMKDLLCHMIDNGFIC